MNCAVCHRLVDTDKRPPGSKTCGTFKCSQTWKSRSSATTRAAKLRGTGKGYVKLNGKYLHRAIAELMLGRKLRKGEIVHHKDENKKNADPLNIMVTTRKKHIEIHRAKMLAKRKEKCGY